MAKTATFLLVHGTFAQGAKWTLSDSPLCREINHWARSMARSGTRWATCLNGKKTAIGVIGTALTAVLSQVAPGSELGQVLAPLIPSAGLSPFAMPVFLAMSAWGILGKFEKWAQGTAPPPN
jgi:hypothetical protein